MIKAFLLVFISFVIVGCDSNKLNPLDSDAVILAFGDSLTVGVGTNEQSSYPQVLARLSGLEVISAGVSGETSDEGLQRFPETIEEYQPDLVILLEGGNDILRNRTYESIEENLSEMIELAKRSEIQIVLIGVPEKRLFSDSAPFYARLAEKHQLVFEPDLVGGLMRSPTLKSDTIHFNKEGYAALAEGIYELLSENGALE